MRVARYTVPDDPDRRRPHDVVGGGSQCVQARSGHREKHHLIGSAQALGHHLVLQRPATYRGRSRRHRSPAATPARRWDADAGVDLVASFGADALAKNESPARRALVLRRSRRPTKATEVHTCIGHNTNRTLVSLPGLERHRECAGLVPARGGGRVLAPSRSGDVSPGARTGLYAAGSLRRRQGAGGGGVRGHRRDTVANTQQHARLRTCFGRSTSSSPSATSGTRSGSGRFVAEQVISSARAGALRADRSCSARRG